MREPNGAISGVVCISVDITKRKKTEDQLRLMVNELNHREQHHRHGPGQLLATLRGADAAVRAAIEGRLIAFASAHDVLTRQSWENAPLSEIVEARFARSADGNDKFRISGPPVALRPRAALALSLASSISIQDAARQHVATMQLALKNEYGKGVVSVVPFPGVLHHCEAVRRPAAPVVPIILSLHRSAN